MREKPDLADEVIIDCLRSDYNLHITSLVFMPLGYDPNASVYRVLTTDGNAYFLKLKRGAVDELSLTIPEFLKTHGLKQVIAPLKTRTGRLRTRVEDFTVLLYPFIDGRSGKEIGLTDSQWSEFGTALKKLHSLELPTELATQIPRETFIPKTSYIKAVDAKIDAGDFNNRFAHELAALWVEKRDEIHHLVERAETLGWQLQAQTHNLVLCHADIHTANVLIGTDGKLWIVDWDTPILAPKERDLIFVTGVGAGAALITSVPGAHGEALFYSGYGKTEIDPMALAYYRYHWALEDIGGFGALIFVVQGVGEETLEDAEYCLRVSFTPGSVAEAARQIDDWV